MIPPSTPIEEAKRALSLTVSLPTHVRTAGDLLVALERGEVEITEEQARTTALLNWLEDGGYAQALARTVRGLEVLTRPGVQFTDTQKARIKALKK